MGMDPSQLQYSDPVWYSQFRQAADDASKAAYQKAITDGQSEDRALNAAKFAWQKVVDEAGLTGYYQGAPTMGSQQWWATNFGTWGTPTAGQQTMSREAQTFGQGTTLANLYGQYYAPGQTPTAGTQTMSAQEQAYTQWLRQQQLQLAQQGQQQQTANQYLTLLSNLRGPADWAKYQQVLGATPGGMSDLVAAAMGQYVPGGGATTGMQPQAANLNTLMAQVQGGNAQAPWQQSTGVQMPGATGVPSSWPQSTYTPMGANAANVAAYTPGAQTGAQPQAAGTPNYQYGARDTGSIINQSGYGPGYGTNTNTMGAPQQTMMNVPASNQIAARSWNQVNPAAGNGTNTMGAPQQNQMNLPAPNQIAAQSWKNMAPSQQQMLLGQYEAQGWHKPDVEALMNQALPKYASNASTAGTWRLR